MSDFLNDAEYRTASWRRRHSPEAIAQLGVWRWKGIQKHAGRILDLICGKRVIDFGGADGPLGFGSIMVDEKANYKTLDDVPGPVDVIFTSHTLEHLDAPAPWLDNACSRLVSGGCNEREEPVEGGRLIAHVPAWTCSRWRQDEYHNPRQPNGHKTTFSLGEATPCDATNILGMLTSFDIELAEYVGDDSIFVIARKP